MSQDFEIKLSDEFKFFAELQLTMHEFAVGDIEPGVKPEWFQGAEIGLTVTMRALVGLTLKTQVADNLTRHVVVSRGEATSDDPCAVYVGFFQNHNRMQNSYTKLFEKDQSAAEYRSVTQNKGTMTQLCVGLTEDIFRFLFTGEVPDILTY